MATNKKIEWHLLIDSETKKTELDKVKSYGKVVKMNAPPNTNEQQIMVFDSLTQEGSLIQEESPIQEESQIQEEGSLIQEEGSPTQEGLVGRYTAKKCDSSYPYYPFPSKSKFKVKELCYEEAEEGVMMDEYEKNKGLQGVLTPSDAEDFDDIRENFSIFKSSRRTLVYAVAVHKNESKNMTTSLRCYHAVPIGGYVYSTKEDSYILNCVNFCFLGYVPFSFVVKMNGAGEWNMITPIPEKVLMRSFSPQQREMMDNFRNSKKEDIEINFIQMVDCN